MLKPSEIRNYEFKPAGRNTYKAEEVDAFFAEVLISYEKMYRENSELIKRINLLADKVDQYKHDEVDIKQAVLSAQKAADIIIRDAEESVEDSKKEAEAILAAAKGEAMVIRTDAEKQAIADADLLTSIAKDKAEDIIKKAKEKAHTILIAANNSASDKMGAANRTITSESLHYDMLKKEVSEFRASILAQYKTHIELISKLPELAIEEAAKIENKPVEEPSIDEVEEEIIDHNFYSSDDSVLEFVDDSADESQAEEKFDEAIESEEVVEDCGEEVVKTTLPYDFFSEDTTLEFIDDEPQDEVDLIIDSEGNISSVPEEYISNEDNDDIVDIEPVSDVSSEQEEETLSFDFNEFTEDNDETEDGQIEASENENIDIFSNSSDDALAYDDSFEENDHSEDDEAVDTEPQKKIIDDYGSYNSFFDSIEVIDTDITDDRDEDKPRKGFFFRKK